jgi:hypothetical protein
MGASDRRPLPGTPSTALITRYTNNRLGAVYSSLYAFWRSRDAAVSALGEPARRDAYSVILFDDQIQECLTNDFTNAPDQLLQAVVVHSARGGTNFGRALRSAQNVMNRHWSTERYVLIDLGELSMGRSHYSKNSGGHIPF